MWWGWWYTLTESLSRIQLRNSGMSSSVHSEAELEGSELPTAMLLVKKPHRSLASACSTYQVLAFAGGGKG